MAKDTPTATPLRHSAEELDRASSQIHRAMTHYTEWCRAEGLAPGVAQLAAIDFIALMIVHNFPTDYEENLQEVIGRLTDRVKSLPKGTAPGPDPEPPHTETRPRAPETVRPAADRRDRGAQRRRPTQRG